MQQVDINMWEKVMLEIIRLTQSVLFRIHCRNTTVAFKQMLNKNEAIEDDMELTLNVISADFMVITDKFIYWVMDH